MLRRDLEVAIRVGNILLDAQELEFVPCSDLFPDTLRTFQEQAAGKLSFADSAIVHVARQQAGGLALTFDGELRKVPGIQVPQ